MQTLSSHKENCILTVTDREYLKYFLPLARSIYEKVDMSNIDFRVHLINVTPEEIQSEFPEAIISSESILLSEKRVRPTRYKEMPLLLNKLISDKHAYCNNKRYELLPQVLQIGYKNILYTDVDQIIRKDIGGLFDIIDEHDITVHRYAYSVFPKPVSWRPFMTYCCGMIGIHNSDQTKMFFDRLWDDTKEGGIYEIGDQADFFSLLKRHRINLKVGQIPHTYKDDKFNEESHIWTGDGHMKYAPEFEEVL